MTDINRNTSLKELAGIVNYTLKAKGIDAVLIGGAAVSIYSDNVYQTYDLDFMSEYRTDLIAIALEPLGFKKGGQGRYFASPDTDFLLEFPSGNLSFGEMDMPVASAATLSDPLGEIRVITPTQSVMDRLSAYLHWKDEGSFEQAVMVAERNSLDWDLLNRWIEGEGAESSIIDLLRSKSGGTSLEAESPDV
jgi:hypothetical protein